MRKATQFAAKGALLDETIEMAEEILDHGLRRIERKLKTKRVEEVSIGKEVESDKEDNDEIKDQQLSSSSQKPILDPPYIRKKGGKNIRKKSPTEKKKYKRKRIEVEDEPSIITKSKKTIQGKTPTNGELININGLSRPQTICNYPQFLPIVLGTRVNMGFRQQAFFPTMFHGQNLLQDSCSQQICPSSVKNSQIPQLTQESSSNYIIGHPNLQAISGTQIYAPSNINNQAIQSSQIQNSWQSLVTRHYNEELLALREDSSQNSLDQLQPES